MKEMRGRLIESERGEERERKKEEEKEKEERGS